MAEIIPSINCLPKDISCVRERVALAGNFARWLHLDIADGAFTFHKSWQDPAGWPGTPCALEVHLMVEDPGHYMDVWSSVPGVQRFIVHIETVTPGMLRVLADKARRRGKVVMLALNPETPAKAVTPYIEETIQFQILGVHPGLSGQKFLPRVLEKISTLRELVPNAIIEVDGGMTPKVAHEARQKGADIIVSDAYIFDSPDPYLAYQELAEA